MQEIRDAVFAKPIGIDLDGVHIQYCSLFQKLSLCQIWCFYQKLKNSCKILHNSAGLVVVFYVTSVTNYAFSR